MRRQALRHAARIVSIGHPWTASAEPQRPPRQDLRPIRRAACVAPITPTGPATPWRSSRRRYTWLPGRRSR